jgi:HAD superfamily hydrolase (TIGR01509 family)
MFRIFGGRAHASFQFNARKPQPQVFERLAARYGVPPARAVVIDDDEEYVVGARQAGLQGILFPGDVELRRRLRAYGFRVKA